MDSLQFFRLFNSICSRMESMFCGMRSEATTRPLEPTRFAPTSVKNPALAPISKNTIPRPSDRPIASWQFVLADPVAVNISMVSLPQVSGCMTARNCTMDPSSKDLPIALNTLPTIGILHTHQISLAKFNRIAFHHGPVVVRALNSLPNVQLVNSISRDRPQLDPWPHPCLFLLFATMRRNGASRYPWFRNRSKMHCSP
jgi:hypothetical protein